MAIELWTSGDLYRVLTDERLDPIPSYFLDRFFPNTYYSDDKEIIFSKLPTKGRKMAPFVLPTEQGKPIFGRKGEKVTSFTPPYMKPKDAVRPTEARTRNPSEILRGAPLTLEQRFDARVVEIMDFHRRAIKTQEAWMAARAILDGKVTVKYERDSGSAHPEVTIDFGRAPGHTVTNEVGTTWDDVDEDIFEQVQGWIDIVRLAEGGGNVDEILVGSAVATKFRKNKSILANMDTRFRGNDTTLQTGLIRFGKPVTRLGTLGAGVEVLAYSDQVENDNGGMVNIMDPRDVLLTAPGVEGVKAYGAIYDVDAFGSEAGPIDIFPKMFKTPDPGELYIMNQSSPLPIPVYPNRTFKARVLA